MSNREEIEEGSRRTTGSRLRASLSAAVYRELKQRIISMDIAPGSPLTESMLVNEFNVSRTPVREALQLLRMEGLVDTLHSLGARVTTSTFTEVLEAYSVRELLEPYAVRLAAIRIADTEVAQLQRLLVDLPEAIVARDDRIKCEEVNRHFHGTLLDASRNQVLADTAKRMIWVTQQATMQLPPSNHQKSREEHSAVLSALRHRNPVEAELAMRQHLRATKAALVQEV